MKQPSICASKKITFFSFKKIIFLSAAVIFISAVAQAQSYPGIGLGVKAGANLTKINGQSFNDGYNLNYNLGLYLQLRLARRFAIQPEVYFSQSTFKTSHNFSDVYNDIPGISSSANDQKGRLNYLNIPILVSIGLTNHLFLQVGPQYGILINDHENLVNNGKDAFKHGDFSGVGGLWLELPLNLNISARYVIGLNNINDIDNSKNWRSQAIQLGIGFTF